MSHNGYARRMTLVASRELRNDTRGLLDRVAAGETIVITVDGRPVAELRALAERPRWISRTDFIADLARWQADPALGADLRSLSDESTDDIAL